MQKIQRIKSNPQDIRIDNSWIESFVNTIKINKKNITKIDEMGKITINPELLRSMSARSEWGEGSSSTKEEIKEDDTMSMASEMSRMSFESARHSVDRHMSLDKKVIGTKLELLMSQSMQMNY